MCPGEAAAHGIFWVRGATDAVFGTFWSGFNYNFVSFVHSLGGELAGLSPVQIGTTVFVTTAWTTNGANMLIGGLLLDRLSTRHCLLLTGFLHMTQAALTYVVLSLRSTASLWQWTLVYGTVCGARGAFQSVVNAQLFGTRALGTIHAHVHVHVPGAPNWRAPA